MGKKFEEILEEAVDKGLSIIGDVTKEVILYFMGELYGVKKGSIGSDPSRVHEALVSILGDGARFAEKSILSALCELIGLEPITVRGKEFLRAIEDARKIYEERCSSSSGI
ncbi:MAG: hypothetical protein QXQ29_05850 [Candidatus Bathyarchaeia archaeon]